MIASARIANIGKKFEDGVLSRASHARGAPDRIAFDQGGEDADPVLKRQSIHDRSSIHPNALAVKHGLTVRLADVAQKSPRLGLLGDVGAQQGF